MPTLGSAATEIGFPPIQRATLKNGLPILLLERHGAPLVQMALAVDAGFASDPDDKAGLASLALGPSRRRHRDSRHVSHRRRARRPRGDDLDRQFARFLLRPLEGAGPDAARRARRLRRRRACAPAFPKIWSNSRSGRGWRGSRRSACSRPPRRCASCRVCSTAVEHPYGKPGTGSGFESTVQTLTRADLVSWHRQWFKPGIVDPDRDR